jgi:dolichol kinase
MTILILTLSLEIQGKFPFSEVHLVWLFWFFYSVNVKRNCRWKFRKIIQKFYEILTFEHSIMPPWLGVHLENRKNNGTRMVYSKNSDTNYCTGEVCGNKIKQI